MRKKLCKGRFLLLFLMQHSLFVNLEIWLKVSIYQQRQIFSYTQISLAHQQLSRSYMFISQCTSEYQPSAPPSFPKIPLNLQTVQDHHPPTPHPLFLNNPDLGIGFSSTDPKIGFLREPQKCFILNFILSFKSS